MKNKWPPKLCHNDCRVLTRNRRIGCRLEWDSWSSREIPLCTTVKQLERFNKEYDTLWRLSQPRIVKTTGCNLPCSYTEYKLATEAQKLDWKSQTLRLGFSSSDVLKRTEKLLYPFESFVSEFGGALGLFLGFSCMMVWDAMEILLISCLKNSQSVERDLR